MSLEDTDPALPPELWRAITDPYISINDSCRLALVNRNMWGRAREHTKWRHLNVNWNKLRKRGAFSLFECPSFKRVKTISLKTKNRTRYLSLCENSEEARNVINDFLQCSLNCSTLEEIEFDLNVSGVSPELLAGTVSKLKGVTFTYLTHLTDLQLTRILEMSPNLVKLVIALPKLNNETVKLLANMTTQLNKLDISSSELKTKEMKVILEKCLQSSNLTDLNLACNNLSGISADMLAKVFSRLHNVNLHYTKLSTKQMTTILNVCSTSTTLKVINFSCMDVSNVSTQLLSTVLPKLEKVNMESTSLTNHQRVQLLVKCLSSANLKVLFLSDFSYYNSLRLVNSNPRRYHLDLSRSCLPPPLLSTILTKALESSTLYNLNLSGTSLSSIPSVLITNVASHLHTLNLCNTKLNTETITNVLKSLLQSTKIKNLSLSCNTLTDVSADLLANVTNKLDEISAEASGLTTEQLTKILQTTTLCNISWNNLCNVPVDLLSEFVSKSIQVSMTNCQLTEEQVTGILQKCLQSSTLKTLDLEGNTLPRSMPLNFFEKKFELQI